MRLRPTFILLFLTLSLIARPAAAQQNAGKNFLLKRFQSTIAFDYLQEFSTSFESYVRDQNSRARTKIAIRFCSTQPLKSTVTKGSIDQSAILRVFGDYGFKD